MENFGNYDTVAIRLSRIAIYAHTITSSTPTEFAIVVESCHDIGIISDLTTRKSKRNQSNTKTVIYSMLLFRMSYAAYTLNDRCIC